MPREKGGKKVVWIIKIVYLNHCFKHRNNLTVLFYLFIFFTSTAICCHSKISFFFFQFSSISHNFLSSTKTQKSFCTCFSWILGFFRCCSLLGIKLIYERGSDYAHRISITWLGASVNIAILSLSEHLATPASLSCSAQCLPDAVACWDQPSTD